MFIPVGNYTQYIRHVDKDADGNVTETQVMGVSVSVIVNHQPNKRPSHLYSMFP
jgi:hypothetical protein